MVEGLLSPEEDQALRSLSFVVLTPAREPAAPAVPAVPAEPRPWAGLLQPEPSQSSTSSWEADHGAWGTRPDASSGIWDCPSGLSSASLSLARYGLHCPKELSSLQLGPQLGCGSCGRVFRGKDAAGATVAVKIVDTWVPVGSTQPSKAQLEAFLSQDLRHPSIVLTTKFALHLHEAAPAWECSVERSRALMPDGWAEEEWKRSGHMIQGKLHQQLWMVQEYCDRGTLGDAVARGWLRTRRSQDAPPHLLAVLLTAQEIASALAYLHSRNILHGDLTPGNVLLCTAPPLLRRHPRDPRGFQAKTLACRECCRAQKLRRRRAAQ
ncbi:hypothetical protein ABPG77_001128 [Micractinium sp. CCAP 211/92]